MKKTSAKKTSASKKRVKFIAHPADKRVNIPTAENRRLTRKSELSPPKADYPRAPEDGMVLNPELMWQGKAAENQSPLSVDAAAIYVQEKIHPLALVDDLRRADSSSSELFENFNGLSDPKARTEFYRHSQNWQNRLILGDSLQAMASLCERESLRGKVQCVYMDPPYGIEFKSFWQPRIVKKSGGDQSRDPEMVRAFRDTWKLGINSYLSYLRDRLAVAKELLTESGSCFVQISGKNVHLVRCVMDEIFGNENFVAEIILKTRSTSTAQYLAVLNDFIVWYAKGAEQMKFRRLFVEQSGDSPRFNSADVNGEVVSRKHLSAEQIKEARFFSSISLASTSGGEGSKEPFNFEGTTHTPPQQRGWRCSLDGLHRLAQSGRIFRSKKAMEGKLSIRFKHFHSDFVYGAVSNFWEEQISEQNKVYVVQTAEKAVQRCMLMTTDPGDLVIDPTCGSGTTAFVAEQWGRRWIAMDASRVAVTLTRARLMGAKFPYYLLKDSEEGAKEEAKLSNAKAPPTKKQYGEDVRQGFICKRVPHITLGSIANNPEIPQIHARHQPVLDGLRKKLNTALKQKWEEWQIPAAAEEQWPKAAKELHSQFIAEKQKRQKAMDDSIAKNAEMETLVDRPLNNKKTIRVCGAFTVESLSPHRVIPADEVVGDDGGDSRPDAETKNETRFWEVVRENLVQSGIKTAGTGARLQFTSVEPWKKAKHIQFTARYDDKKGIEKKAAICIGPEYGTVSRPLLVEAGREAVDYFDTLIVLGYAFEADTGEDTVNLGDFPVIRARMNNDLRMANHLQTSKGDRRDNLFVSIGEPDIALYELDGDMLQVEIRGIDIFDPVTGEVESKDKNDIACWFIDTDYNGESFFVRRAHFYAAAAGKAPYAELKKALSADISEEAWESLRATKSRPFPRPSGNKIAVKAVNLFGEESIKILSLSA